MPVQARRVRSRGWDDPLKKEMTTHSSILAWEYFAWEIPWTEGLGGLPSVGSQRVGRDLATKHTTKH